ncbi:ExbD/TolR family protein [Engelhardtia mirabilis]|uniref:Biopolymer transport protein ExbD/TolR n=1 Tax=Engelhardtia mirabilis TaxID=2528011 RepID=A0A518BI76_9BACT|nr:Biopolymer transport protein ExbD/TolR [Planctomycetes bacterium Pla133]QDV00990.1 Biopolymer transport protein ExbD/TolR [Planctomycetes bacterium Pla86]
MQMSKHDPETDMEMNMTPMIDVVFLLIIFFMIITDLTQQELEQLVLPVAVEAVEDKPDKDERRPIVNIKQDGTIIVRREVIYTPEEDDYTRLKEYLVDMAQLMDKDTPEGLSVMVPDDPILIRADENTPFKMIQKIMELCGQKGIQIWKVELAASRPPDEGPGI